MRVVPGRLVELMRPRAKWLLPGTLATVVLVVALTALVGASVTNHLRHGDGVRAVDQPVATWVAAHRVDWLTAIMRLVTTVGCPLGVALTVVAVVGIAEWRTRRLRPALVAAVVLGGAELLQISIKSLVARARPPSTLWAPGASASGFSFPSGHATLAAAGYGLIAGLLVQYCRTTRARLAVCVAAAGATAAVGLSRVYLGVHWLSDVAVGWLIGGLWLGVVCLVAQASRAGPASVPRPELSSKFPARGTRRS
jgi:undecaprenyl-diphosphatase